MRQAGKSVLVTPLSLAIRVETVTLHFAISKTVLFFPQWLALFGQHTCSLGYTRVIHECELCTNPNPNLTLTLTNHTICARLLVHDYSVHPKLQVCRLVSVLRIFAAHDVPHSRIAGLYQMYAFI